MQLGAVRIKTKHGKLLSSEFINLKIKTTVFTWIVSLGSVGLLTWIAYIIHENASREGQVGYQEKGLHQRVVGHWNTLPRAAVTARRLPGFQFCMIYCGARSWVSVILPGLLQHLFRVLCCGSRWKSTTDAR